MTTLRRRATHNGSRSTAPKTDHAELRMRSIIDESARLFDLHGYGRVSMENIAAAVGLAKPTMYHYVKSKEQLLARIHDEFMTMALTRSELPERATMSPAAQLAEIMNDILQLMHTHRGHVRVFFEHHRELPPAAQRRIREKREQYGLMVRRVLSRGIAQRELRQVDPTLAALALFGMCNWAYQWYDPRGRLPPERIAATFADYFLSGVAYRGSAGGSRRGMRTLPTSRKARVANGPPKRTRTASPTRS
jgi:AcrR family transcriptional regulator